MDRPLPYLIGSQAFMEQDDVGLGDLSSDGKTLTAALSVPQLDINNLNVIFRTIG